MLIGNEFIFEQVCLFDIVFVLYVDYGMNVLIFMVIVISLIFSDMYFCMVSVIGVFKGLLYGGVNEVVMIMFDEIGIVDKVEVYIMGKFDNKEKIMGVGYCVYKYFDFCLCVLCDYVEYVVNKEGKSNYYQIFEVIEKIIVDCMGVKGIYFNVDFYFGIVYSDLGIKKEYFIFIFVLVCISGWCVSVIEYSQDNCLLCFDVEYIGVCDQYYVDIKDCQ